MKQCRKLRGKWQSIWRNKKVPLAFLAPGLIGTVIFVLLPFGDVIRRSFYSSVTGEWQGLSGYRLVFENGAFRRAVWNTLRFVLCCLPLLIILGFLVALLLTGGRRPGAVKTLFLFPMAMPAAVVVLVWKMVFGQGGFLGQLLYRPEGFMESGSAFWVLVFSYLWKNLGYTIVLWIAGIAALPGDMFEAARVDGAGEVAILQKILLPNLKGVLYTITVLSFLNSFKVFREAYLVAGSYPQENIYLLQHLFNNWFVRLEMDKLAAAAVCLGIVLLAVILLFQHFWDREETM